MHPINRLLSRFGLQLKRNSAPPPFPPEFAASYERTLKELQQNPGGFRIFRDPRYDVGDHPESYMDFECAFAADQIGKLCPDSILDLGSYRHFILGLAARFQITTIDVRRRRSLLDREAVITCSAESLPFPNESFDVVLSLCALEHFGLGRYGDDIDLDADQKAFRHMVRVLKPGGHLIFTTTITRAERSLAFNAHRIYDRRAIRAFCSGLLLVEERYFSHTLQRYCSFDELTDQPGVWDLYCGCWRKEQ